MSDVKGVLQLFLFVFLNVSVFDCRSKRCGLPDLFLLLLTGFFEQC